VQAGRCDDLGPGQFRSKQDSFMSLPTATGGIAMNAWMKKIRNFLQSEDGPTAVEYAVMLALIVVVCLTTIQSLGTNANATFQSVSTAIQTANS
jgi:pilus assembly protein Flp/PilA